MFFKPDPERVALLKYLVAKLGLVVLMAVLAVLLPVLLPLALLSLAVSERLRRCPNCGQRGTLRDVTPPRSPVAVTGDETGALWLPRSRVVMTRVFRCKVCSALFESRGDEPLCPVSGDPVPSS